MSRIRRGAHHRAAGFSLVELMVGVVVSLIVTLAITASVSTINQQRKTTVSGIGAQESALIALTSIERSARMAGAGMFSGSELLCASLNYYRDGVTVADGDPFFPVSITSGGATGSDSLRFAYSGEPGGITNVRIVNDMPQPSSVFTVNQSGPLQDGSIAIVGVPGSGRPCTLFQVTAVQSEGGGNCGGVVEDCQNILHNSGQSDFNPPQPENVFKDAPRYGYDNDGVVIGPAVIMNIGMPVQQEFRVMCNSLVMHTPLVGGAPSCTPAPLTFTNVDALAGDIVQMKAQYGISNAATSSVVVDWVNATGSWAAPTEDERKRIKAVRVAVVARSTEPASMNVSAACINGGGVVNTGPCSFQDAKAPVIDLSAVPVPPGMTWQRYRYRVHQTVIPLRNLTWNDE